MDMVADVICYHCGWISGRVAGLRGTPQHMWAFEDRSGERMPLMPGKRLSCTRCSGPVYAEDLRPRALSEPLGAPGKTKLAGAA